MNASNESFARIFGLCRKKELMQPTKKFCVKFVTVVVVGLFQKLAYACLP